MRKTERRLALRRETLYLLAEDQLQGAAGGSCSDTCYCTVSMCKDGCYTEKGCETVTEGP
jgi:hypothetical protein